MVRAAIRVNDIILEFLFALVNRRTCVTQYSTAEMQTDSIFSVLFAHCVKPVHLIKPLSGERKEQITAENRKAKRRGVEVIQFPALSASVDFFYVLQTVAVQKLLQVGGISDEHDLLKFPGVHILKARHLLTGTHTAPQNRLQVFFLGVYLNKKLLHDIVKYTIYSVLFKYTTTIYSSTFNIVSYLQATFSRFKRQISDKF